MSSVADLLNDHTLALRSVHLPNPAAELRWTAVSELDDPTPFLEGGEILLTTALEMGGWTTEWDDYIRRLAGARVCALGLAVGLTVESAPDDLIAAARRWQLNLVEVPRRTTFVAISRAVADLVRAEESRAAQRSLELHQALTRAAARSDEPDGILYTLAGALDGMAALVGVDGGVQAGPFGPHADMFVEGLVAEEVARIRPRGLRAASSVPGSGGTLTLQPVGAGGRPARYLIAGFGGSTTSVHRSAIAAAVVLLNLAEEHRQSRQATRRRIATRAIELLIHGDRRGADLLLGATDGDIVWPETCLVLRASGSSAGELADALDELERHRAPDIVAQAVVGNELVVIGTPSAVAAVAEVAARELRVGMGRPVSVGEIDVGFRTAGIALVGAPVGGPPVAWRERVVEGIGALLDPDRAEAFADGLLAPLRNADDLRATLGSFLRHHGSHAAVARELGVHRNTVAQRVQVIETRLGRSLDDPQARADLWIALQIARG